MADRRCLKQPGQFHPSAGYPSAFPVYPIYHGSHKECQPDKRRYPHRLTVMDYPLPDFRKDMKKELSGGIQDILPHRVKAQEYLQVVF